VTSDVAASVHQRLLNRAHATGRPFNELLHYLDIAGQLFEQHWLAGAAGMKTRL
jgi:hypothetical protein